MARNRFRLVNSVSTEVIEVERRTIAGPRVVLVFQAPAVEIPVGDVVAGILLHKIIIKQPRKEIDETLIDEVTLRVIDDTLVVDFSLPPMKKFSYGRR